LVNNGLPANKNYTAIAVSGNNIFAATYGKGIYLSSNNGQLWTAVNSGLANTYVMSLIIHGDTLFAGTVLGPVYRSLNNGGSWDTVNTGIPANLTVTSFAISGNYIFAGTGHGEVYISSNNGNSWANWDTTGLSGTGDVNALVINNNNIFAGTWNGGVRVSSDIGVTWTADNTGLTDTIVRALAISGNYIFAGTDSGGVWRMAFPVSGINEIKNNDNGISIYPNPATDNITIDASKLQFANLNLRMYDVVGNLILEKNTGNNKTDLNVSALPNGVYIIEIMTGKGITAKKVVKE
jgi:hypothetical protein